MSFHFQVNVRPFDFFRMSMRKTYSSPVGVCNIVFTVAAILLTLKLFPKATDGIQLLLVIMCLIFPVLQPLGVFFKARALAGGIPRGLTMDVDDTGLTVSVGPQSEKIAWKRVGLLIDNKDMLIIKLDGNNGYFLTNRVLKDDREAFKEYVLSRLRNR